MVIRPHSERLRIGKREYVRVSAVRASDNHFIDVEGVTRRGANSCLDHLRLLSSRKMGYGQVGNFQGRQVVQVHPRAIRDLRKCHRTRRGSVESL